MVFRRARPERNRSRSRTRRARGTSRRQCAGKSTLIKVLSGVELPDSGEIRVQGRPVAIRSPKSAMRLGIETVYQYNSFVPNMSVSRNLFIGREPLIFSAGGIASRISEGCRGFARAIADVDLHLRSPHPLVGELSGGQPGRRDRPRNVLQVQGADSRRADQSSSSGRPSKVLGFVKRPRGAERDDNSHQPQSSPCLRLLPASCRDGERQNRAG